MWRRVLPIMPPFLMKDLVEMTPNWRHTRTQRFHCTMDSVVSEVKCSPDGTKILVSRQQCPYIISIKPTSLGQTTYHSHQKCTLTKWSGDNTIIVCKQNEHFEDLFLSSTFERVDDTMTVATNFKLLNWSGDFSKLVAHSMRQTSEHTCEFQFRVYEPNLRFFRTIGLHIGASRIDNRSSLNYNASIFIVVSSCKLQFISTKIGATFGKLLAECNMYASVIVNVFWTSVDTFLVVSRTSFASPNDVDEYRIVCKTQLSYDVVHLQKHMIPPSAQNGRSYKISPNRKLLAFYGAMGKTAYIWDLEHCQFVYMHPTDKNMVISAVEWHPSSAKLIVVQYSVVVGDQEMYYVSNFTIVCAR